MAAPRPSDALPGPATQQVIPKDGQVIAAILKDMGIVEYEPRVIHQLLEFSYRYVTSLLDDAQVFSAYSKKKNIDIEDIRLAVQMQVDKMFTSPPPRDLISDIARHKNSVPLPPIKSHAGPRLPPDRYSLIACNFKMKPADKIVNPNGPHSANISLPFRPGNSTPVLARSQGMTMQPRLIGNRLTITPVNADAKPGVSVGIKRKLEDS
jgi:histone H3/H4